MARSKMYRATSRSAKFCQKNCPDRGCREKLRHRLPITFQSFGDDSAFGKCPLPMREKVAEPQARLDEGAEQCCLALCELTGLPKSW